MIVHRNIQQGALAWLYLRLGMITMSNLDKIITPKTMKPSASQNAYMDKLIAELWYKRPLDTYVSPSMQRGTDEEEVSIGVYAFENNCIVEKVAFIEEGPAGCSPDGMVIEGAVIDATNRWSHGVEAKNPDPGTHAGYRDRPETLREKYWCQVQGCLMITKLDKWHLFSGDEMMPPVQLEIGRDEKFIALASEFIGEFNERFIIRKRADGLSDRVQPLLSPLI